MTQVRARTAGDGVVPRVRPLRWPRLWLSSFLAGLTGLILLVAVGALLGQGRLGTLQHATSGGVPVKQDGSGRAVLLLMAGQLAEPFQARG